MCNRNLSLNIGIVILVIPSSWYNWTPPTVVVVVVVVVDDTIMIYHNPFGYQNWAFNCEMDVNHISFV